MSKGGAEENVPHRSVAKSEAKWNQPQNRHVTTTRIFRR
jgi:hypothetical protein